MKEQLRILKNRLLLKRLSIRIEEVVHENFGYSPSYPWFNELLDKKCQIASEVRKLDRTWYETSFEPIEYSEKFNLVNVYTP